MTNPRMVCLMAALAAFAQADTIHFRNGTSIQGTLLSSNAREVSFLGPDGAARSFTRDGIASIEVSSPAQGSGAAAAVPANARLVVPAGTRITVRMIDNIDSTTTRAGERFRASIDDPVVLGSQVVIPRGADSTVQIIEASSNKELSIKLYDVTVGGKAIDVVSSYAELQATGTSKGKKAARRGIGLGAIGAGIGGIAGGGEGAAIGAIAGAGLEAISGAAASGKSLKVPAETRLTFELRSPLPLG